MSQQRPQYRRTGSGAWAVYGPVLLVKAGQEVTVYKKDGSTSTEMVDRVGKPFDVDGTAMIYGYPRPRASWSKASRRRAGGTPRSCDDCQWIEDAGDAQGCARHRGNPQN